MKKVLIAEDSRTLTTALQLSLETYRDSFETLFVENGLEAMKILQTESIDLVVTDINMPVMDGLVLLAFMLETCPRTPCIIMSGFADANLKEELKDNILHFIDKPVIPDQLARTILKTLKTPPGKEGIKKATFADLVGLIMKGRKTCVFQLKSETGAQGLFYFQDGELYNAVCGKIQGDDAFEKIIRWGEADIRFMKAPRSRGHKMIKTEMKDLLHRIRSANLIIRSLTRQAVGENR